MIILFSRMQIKSLKLTLSSGSIISLIYFAISFSSLNYSVDFIYLRKKFILALKISEDIIIS